MKLPADVKAAAVAAADALGMSFARYTAAALREKLEAERLVWPADLGPASSYTISITFTVPTSVEQPTGFARAITAALSDTTTRCGAPPTAVTLQANLGAASRPVSKSTETVNRMEHHESLGGRVCD